MVLRERGVAARGRAAREVARESAAAVAARGAWHRCTLAFNNVAAEVGTAAVHHARKLPAEPGGLRAIRVPVHRVAAHSRRLVVCSDPLRSAKSLTTADFAIAVAVFIRLGSQVLEPAHASVSVSCVQSAYTFASDVFSALPRRLTSTPPVRSRLAFRIEYSRRWSCIACASTKSTVSASLGRLPDVASPRPAPPITHRGLRRTIGEW